jgi:flagella basal body P-ring formation protein FlgA
MEYTINVTSLKREMKLYWVIASRLSVLVLCALMGFILLLVGSKISHAASLRSSVTLEEGSLTVGDLFDGVDDRVSSYVLGPGPKAGEQMTLNARTLQRVALAMDMTWRPSNSSEQITIYRDATVIDKNIIMAALNKKLEQHGFSGSFHVSLVNKDPKMTILPTLPATVDIDSLRITSDNGSFTAKLKAPSLDNVKAQLMISGTITQMISVPVINTTMRNEDIISKYDIDWIDIPEKALQHDTLLKAESLVGMTPRRMIIQNRPVKAAEVIQPQIIKRGEIVTITFKSGPLLLTAEGKALENGAKDDMIRVVNTESSRPLKAKVIGDKTVLVR